MWKNSSCKYHRNMLFGVPERFPSSDSSAKEHRNFHNLVESRARGFRWKRLVTDSSKSPVFLGSVISFSPESGQVDSGQVDSGESTQATANGRQKTCCWRFWWCFRLAIPFALLIAWPSGSAIFGGRCCYAREARRKLQIQTNCSLREAQSN